MLRSRKSAWQFCPVWRNGITVYLYGKHDVMVHSDHQPLETIFKKPLSRAPHRLQKMMLRFQNYHFTVQYKKGKELFVADTVSRAALSYGPESPSGMTQDYIVFCVVPHRYTCHQTLSNLVQ